MRVLIVEDDMIIAGELGPVVTESGHDLVGLAADRDTAVALLSSTTVHLALIDLRLADGWTGVDVARAAARNGVAGVFTTANPSLLPADLAGACGVIEKPYSPRGMKAALDHLADIIAGRPVGEPPRCLEVSTAWRRAAAAQQTAPERRKPARPVLPSHDRPTV